MGFASCSQADPSSATITCGAATRDPGMHQAPINLNPKEPLAPIAPEEFMANLCRALGSSDSCLDASTGLGAL